MNLNQITIPSKDVENAVAFYKTLGLKLIVNALPRYVRFECPEGDSTFSIHLENDFQPKNGITIYFECENLDLKVEQLCAKGIVFKSLPKDETWLWREARLTDLDGNQIILYKAGHNRKNPPWRLT